jgi:hypothetical protein
MIYLEGVACVGADCTFVWYMVVLAKIVFVVQVSNIAGL